MHKQIGFGAFDQSALRRMGMHANEWLKKNKIKFVCTQSSVSLAIPSGATTAFEAYAELDIGAREWREIREH